MAHTLTLVYGNTTVAMASGDYRIRQYVPATPEPGASSVTETATILITGSTLAALQADIRAINQMFERARMRQAGKTLVRTFVKFQASGEATTWLSEIYDGRVVMPEGALAGDWANTQLEVAVIWERAPFWEGDTWIAVPLTNGNGTDVVDGLRIYNNNDNSGSSPTKKNNYAKITGTDIVSELPAPVKLVVIGDVAALSICHQVDLMGLGVLTAPESQFEDWSGTGLTPTADNLSSGGQFNRLAHTGGSWKIIYKDIDLSDYKGSYHKIFIRFSAAPSPAPKLHLWIGYNDGGANLLTDTAIIKQSVLLQELGDLRLPPGRSGLPGSGALGSFRLWLSIYSDAAANIDLDVMYMLPVESYIYLKSLAVGSLSWDRLTYAEGLDSLLYGDTAATGANKRNNFSMQGNGIWLTPGVDQALHFLWPYSNPSIAYNALVSAWYKPRRVNL